MEFEKKIIIDIKKEIKGLSFLLIHNKKIYRDSKKAVHEISGAIFILKKLLIGNTKQKKNKK